jgi:small ubiquitin-related modifier
MSQSIDESNLISNTSQTSTEDQQTSISDVSENMLIPLTDTNTNTRKKALIFLVDDQVPTTSSNIPSTTIETSLDTQTGINAEPEPETEPEVDSPKDIKPNIYIRIKMVGQDSQELHFKIKRITKFAKIKKSYCNRKGLKSGLLRFLYEGHRVQDSHTPDYLNMKDGDVIDVFAEQTGG